MSQKKYVGGCESIYWPWVKPCFFALWWNVNYETKKRTKDSLWCDRGICLEHIILKMNNGRWAVTFHNKEKVCWPIYSPMIMSFLFRGQFDKYSCRGLWRGACISDARWTSSPWFNQMYGSDSKMSFKHFLFELMPLKLSVSLDHRYMSVSHAKTQVCYKIQKQLDQFNLATPANTQSLNNRSEAHCKVSSDHSGLTMSTVHLTIFANKNNLKLWIEIICKSINICITGA